MNSYHTFKHYLKIGRWRARRSIVALRWGGERSNSMPIVLGNAMPKSGSHLIIQVLQGLTRIGPFVNPGFPPVNRAEDNSILSEDAMVANIRQMRPGDIGYGYIGAREPFTSLLTQPGMASVFVYRDPRDMIVSHVFYATEMHPGHGMHRYYTEELHTMEERINAAIKGVQVRGSELPDIRERYNAYLGWLSHPEVLCLRFEDLVLDRDMAFGRLLDFLEAHGFSPDVTRAAAVDALKKAIIPRKSGTFRKGKPGSWREYFTEANKGAFKSQADDLLNRLGYEKDNNW